MYDVGPLGGDHLDQRRVPAGAPKRLASRRALFPSMSTMPISSTPCRALRAGTDCWETKC